MISISTHLEQTQALFLENGPEATKYVQSFWFTDILERMFSNKHSKSETYDDMQQTFGEEKEQFEIVKIIV